MQYCAQTEFEEISAVKSCDTLTSEPDYPCQVSDLDVLTPTSTPAPAPSSASATKSRRSLKTILLWSLVTGLFLAAILSFYFLLLKTGRMQRFAAATRIVVKRAYTERPAATLCAVFGLMILVIVGCIASHTLLAVATFAALDNFWLGLGVLLPASMVADLLIRGITASGLRAFIAARCGKSPLFEVLAEESRASPFKTAFCTRFLLIPVGIKGYLLSIVGNPRSSYFLSGLVEHTLDLTKAFFIAKELAEVGEMFGPRRGWAVKSPLQKLVFVVTLCLFLLSLALVVLLGISIAKKLRAKKTRLCATDFAEANLKVVN